MSARAALFVLEALVAGAIGLLLGESARPGVPVAGEQPLRFDHRTHPISCETCHAGATGGVRAGLPAVQTCMECHGASAERKVSPLTDKVREAQAAGRPIAWKVFTRLPSHVFFSHRRHTTVGKIACVDCHGQIGSSTMQGMRIQIHTMDSCMECHERKGVTNDCAACHR